MTRFTAVAAVVVLAGCGAGPPEQEAAEDAVARTAGGEAECTGRSRTWVAEGPPAEVFVCVVRAGNGFCDRYRVDRDGASFRVRLLERKGSCVLPAG